MMRERRTTDTRSRRWMTALTVASVLTLTGCGSDVLDNPYEKSSPAATADSAAILETLPSLEDTEVQLESAVVQIGAFVDTLVPGMEWTWIRERSVGGCGRPFDGTDGDDVQLKNYVSAGPIPDAVWPQVFEFATRVATAAGATKVQTFHDDPDNHEVRFYSPERTAIFIGSRGAVISANTGCRLPQAKMPGVAAPQTPVTPNP
ncbi:LppA family lipoprotein [Rhodococcus sp. BGS-1C]|uniref:LppA family lipoprotein n=1 Tax=Rhodococcus sp. BGS-1C TaxID=2100132 RepID=UPI003DA09FB9